MTDSERLRLYLGESIPEGGTAADTFFTDAQVTDLLAGSESVFAAAAEGWRIKAAEYSHLVDVSEGGSSRNLSALYKQALAELEHYGSLTTGAPDARKVRIKSIQR